LHVEEQRRCIARDFSQRTRFQVQDRVEKEDQQPKSSSATCFEDIKEKMLAAEISSERSKKSKMNLNKFTK